MQTKLQMPEDVLDPALLSQADQRNAFFYKLTKWLLVLAIILSMANVAVSFATIPDSAELTYPLSLSNMKVTYVLTIAFLFIFPVAALCLGFVFGALHIRKLRYLQRVWLFSLIILVLAQSLFLYQLIVESFTY